LLGFVIGMTFTFGGVIPTVAGSIILSFCAIIYLVIRPAILYVAAKVTHTASSNK
jgi:hypothetical protein